MSTELTFTTHDDTELTIEVIETGELYADGETTMIATEPLIVIFDEHDELGMFALAGLNPSDQLVTWAFPLTATDVTGLLDAIKAHREPVVTDHAAALDDYAAALAEARNLIAVGEPADPLAHADEVASALAALVQAIDNVDRTA